MRDEELENSFAPLVALLQQELARARLAAPGPMPTSVADFTRWYLAVVQLLEVHVAQGSEHGPMTRGEVELLCRSALSGATLGQGIDLCRRFCDMLAPRAGQVSLETRGDTARFLLDSRRANPGSASNLVDIAGLFAFSQLFQWLVGRELPLQRVSIGPIEREDVMPFLKLFRAPVLAGGDHYALDFHRNALDWVNVRDAGDFDRFFELFPCEVFDATVTDLPHQVSALLYAAVQQGERLPSQQQVAATLDIALTTLRRRLAGAGRPFRQLREECLRDCAQRLLLRGDLTVAAIAQRLGFSDAGAFRRAFHRWTGEAPRGYHSGGDPVGHSVPGVDPL